MKSNKKIAPFGAEAQYLIGESFFAEKEFRQAAAAYNTVRKTYSKSANWVPRALFRLGQCFERLDLKADAKILYETVVKSYSKHAVAKDAKQRLSALK